MKIKIWLLYLLGLSAGLVLGLLIPPEIKITGVVSMIADLSIRIFRVLLYPLVFSSLAVAVCQLRREKRLLRYSVRGAVYTAIAGLTMIIVGVIVTLISNPRRIKITSQEPLPAENKGLLEVLHTIFPYNFFDVFQSGNDALFVLLLLAAVIGYHMHFDREIAEPAFNLFDSLSRLLYRINRFIISINFLFLIPVTAYMVLIFRETSSLSDYSSLIIVLLVVSVLFLFGLIPGVIMLLKIKENPFKILFGLLVPAIAGSVSSDNFYMAGHSIICNNENLGITRKMGAPLQSIGILFSRTGTAAVSAVSMLFILKSYSNLELTFFQILWVVFFSFLASFLTFQNPVIPAYISLSLMCTLYGRGLEKGFLILVPVIPVLNRIAILLDGTVSNFTAYLISRKEEDRNIIPTNEYI
jgi:Na+/H+-dicarboxylate symporter